MEYTRSDANITHPGTGNRMHQESEPVTTAVGASDMNMVIWSLMEVLKLAKVPSVRFNTDEPSSYQAFARAVTNLRRTFCPQDAPWNAVGDGIIDDTAALASFFADLPSNCNVDLAGGRYKVFDGVNGVSVGDAYPLNGLPRLVNKSGITIKNGVIFAANPGVSGTKVRFPTTLTIDGCSGIRFSNVDLLSRGENYGDSDASEPLGFEARRSFLAQNGGHALAVIRSRGVRGTSCNFSRCGSVAPFYVSSSDKVDFNGSHSSPESLGYAGYAADSWCGPVATSGFKRHELILRNCSSDDNGSTYGSKGCVVAEDRDVVVRVLGGKYADAYANASAQFIGAAFIVCSARMYVNGAQVDNCAAIGTTFHSSDSVCELVCVGVQASDLRTSMHINDVNSFGETRVRYQGVRARYASTPKLWGVDELSELTVVANMKVASAFTLELDGCNVVGAKYLSWNKRGCYGGIRIIDGYYELQEQIFKSKGWGGSEAGSGRGFEVLGSARFRITSTAATTPISDIVNNDGLGVVTRLCVEFAEGVVVDSLKFRVAEEIIDTTGGTVTERRRFRLSYIGCGSKESQGQRTSAIKVVSKDGIFGGNYRLTVEYPSGIPMLGLTFDDVVAPRSMLSFNMAPALVGGAIQAQVNVSGTGSSWSVGGSYAVISS